MSVTSSSREGDLDIPVGRHVIRTFRFALSGTGQTGDSIDTGLSEITAVLGACTLPNAGFHGLVTRLNAAGYSSDEGTSPGLLAVMANSSCATTYTVTVIGIP